MPSKKSDNRYGHKIWILGNKCYRCEHEWKPREIEDVPKVCPLCKSPYWDIPKKEK